MRPPGELGHRMTAIGFRHPELRQGFPPRTPGQAPGRREPAVSVLGRSRYDDLALSCFSLGLRPFLYAAVSSDPLLGGAKWRARPPVICYLPQRPDRFPTPVWRPARRRPTA